MSTQVVFGITFRQIKDAIFRPVQKRLNSAKYVESLFAAPEETELLSKERRRSVEALLAFAVTQPDAYTRVRASARAVQFAPPEALPIQNHDGIELILKSAEELNEFHRINFRKFAAVHAAQGSKQQQRAWNDLRSDLRGLSVSMQLAELSLVRFNLRPDDEWLSRQVEMASTRLKTQKLSSSFHFKPEP